MVINFAYRYTVFNGEAKIPLSLEVVIATCYDLSIEKHFRYKLYSFNGLSIVALCCVTQTYLPKIVTAKAVVLYSQQLMFLFAKRLEHFLLCATSTGEEGPFKFPLIKSIK